MFKVKQATKDGYILCRDTALVDLSYPTSTKRRGRVQLGGGGLSHNYNYNRSVQGYVR